MATLQLTVNVRDEYIEQIKKFAIDKVGACTDEDVKSFLQSECEYWLSPDSEFEWSIEDSLDQSF